MTDYTKAFETWWSHYPRRVGKRAAFKAWLSACKRSSEEHLLERVQAYSKSRLVATTARQYIPHGSVWLNQDRFDDDPAEWGDPGEVPQVTRTGEEMLKEWLSKPWTP